MVLRCFALTVLAAIAAAQPSVRVSGGITLNGALQPLLFTWNSQVPVAGTGWSPGEAVRIFLRGPLDFGGVRRVDRLQPGPVFPPAQRPRGTIVPTDLLPLGGLTADAQGNLSGTVTIPYDGGSTGPQVRIPMPGYYEVRAVGPASGTAAAPTRINLCPDTYTGPGATAAFDWGRERGARDGILPGILRQYSPERFDPEWPTVWSERPVEVYGTVISEAGTAADQPSRISPSDNPPTHYAHDSIVFLDPDPAWQWLIGTANYYQGEPDSADLGHLELEWETLNGGSTATYGQGNIGTPVWAKPSPGDRIYAMGRWILDAGHPEIGDRTEMHPPRLLATFRRLPAALNGMAASQVDVFVSGHGGGANMMPPGLSTLLDQSGWGGGRIRDVLNSADQDRYYRAGPLSTFLYPLLVGLVQQLAGITISAPIFGDAGPSAFPWGTPGAEQRAINDRDYDFDVPLPTPPAGARAVVMDAITHPEHSTSVKEEVSYPRRFDGAAPVAHVHLPYLGADNGIYARTLRFAWVAGPPPVSHWRVQLTRIDVTDSAGKWQMWADVAGQWSYLTGAAPQLLNTSNGASIALPGGPVDIYANAGQTIRIDVHGYRAACLDDFFGQLFGQSSYFAGLTFVGQCGPNDNQDLGTAILELPAQASSAGIHTVAAADSSGAHHYSVTISIAAM